MDNLYSITVDYYRRAVEKAREKKLSSAFCLYAKAFLDRLNCPRCNENEFTSFYRTQLATYLVCKKNYYLALPEGDMISDLILDAYNKFVEDVSFSRIKITKEGRENLLLHLKVDFPLLDEESMSL